MITNNASPQLERLPKPVLHHEAALGYAPHPAEYFIPTGNKVSPIVITTTPETIGVYPNKPRSINRRRANRSSLQSLTGIKYPEEEE